MLIVISPSKNMDATDRGTPYGFSQPEFLDKASQLVKLMKKYSAGELGKLLKINPTLAQLNFERYQQWQTPFTKDNSKPAIYTFIGEVFHGLEAESLTKEDINFAQKHLRIFSGLYGILAPNDLIQPYRLDIADPVRIKGKSLYEFWKQSITEKLIQDLSENPSEILVNLASNEYFKSIDSKKITTKIITPVFKEAKGNGYKIITMYAKKARGLMTRFIIQNQLTELDELKLFDKDGYFYNEALSNNEEIVFTR